MLSKIHVTATSVRLSKGQSPPPPTVIHGPTLTRTIKQHGQMLFFYMLFRWEMEKQKVILSIGAKDPSYNGSCFVLFFFEWEGKVEFTDRLQEYTRFAKWRIFGTTEFGNSALSVITPIVLTNMRLNKLWGVHGLVWSVITGVGNGACF